MKNNNESKMQLNKENISRKRGEHLSHLNNISTDKNRILAKNIFLSFPKLNRNKNKFSKTILKALNLTLINNRNNRNKSIDSYQENKSKYETTQTMPNIPKKNIINVTIIDKNKYYLPKNDKFSIVIKKSKLEQNNISKKNEKINYITTYKDSISHNFKKLEPFKTKSNKIPGQRKLKTQNINFFHKKPSIDYLTPIFKNSKIFRIKEQPNLKVFNVGYLMKKVFNDKNNISLLKNENKCDENEGKINLKAYFMRRDKFYSEEKEKELKYRNSFFNKIKTSNSEKKEKKIIPIRNCHEVLEFYKNNKFESCKKLIEQTLLDVKKEKNFICDFFSNYKKVFDVYDDWNSPKNKDNLYNI